MASRPAPISRNPSFNSISSSVPTPTGPLPRIICLHGGGTSALIFNVQTVRIQRLLREYFQFTFVDAPFESDPGPGVTPFFDGMPPYWRWSRRQPGEHGEQVRATIERALAGEGQGVVRGLGDKTTSVGPVVGVLGFSQGGQLATGLLAEQQRRSKAGEVGFGFRFGILCMSGHPMIKPSTGATAEPELPTTALDEESRGSITTPSLHILGTQDKYVEFGRLLHQYYHPETAILQEYDLEHRLPTSQEDNEKVAAAILELYRNTLSPSDRIDMTLPA